MNETQVRLSTEAGVVGIPTRPEAGSDGRKKRGKKNTEYPGNHRYGSLTEVSRVSGAATQL